MFQASVPVSAGSVVAGPAAWCLALGGGSGWIYVQTDNYWSGTVFAPNPSNAWNFNGPRRAAPSGPAPPGGRPQRSGGQGAKGRNGNQNDDNQNNPLFAVAVLPGG